MYISSFQFISRYIFQEADFVRHFRKQYFHYFCKSGSADATRICSSWCVHAINNLFEKNILFMFSVGFDFNAISSIILHIAAKQCEFLECMYYI